MSRFKLFGAVENHARKRYQEKKQRKKCEGKSKSDHCGAAKDIASVDLVL
jgi:hypothetical protein